MSKGQARRAVCGNLMVSSGSAISVAAEAHRRIRQATATGTASNRSSGKGKAHNMLTIPTEMACYVATKNPDGTTTGAIQWRPLSDLPAGDILIRVRYSSLNYKDALSATGQPGVTKHYPHVPGIDAAGLVMASSSPRFRVGDQVIVTGYDLGAGRWGGYSQFIRVPADWPVPLPIGLSLRESMILGTAGFTAAQCVAALLAHGVRPRERRSRRDRRQRGSGERGGRHSGQLGLSRRRSERQTGGRRPARRVGRPRNLAPRCRARHFVPTASFRPLGRGGRHGRRTRRSPPSFDRSS